MSAARRLLAAAAVAAAAFLAPGAGPAPAQDACRDLHGCLGGLARETAQILSREAGRAGGRLSASFRPAFAEPSGVRIYCRELSMRLRNVLHELVQDERDRYDLDFDVRAADRGRVEPPEATMAWTRDRAAGGAETMALEAHIALAEGRSRRLSASVPAAALSAGERACLFDFRAGEAWVETRDRVVLREEPTFRPGAEVAVLRPGAELRVVGRIDAPGRAGEDWFAVAWTDPDTNERRNLFATGLGYLVEAGRADGEAFAAARRAGTVSAYDAYLSAWPSGRHVAEARRLRDAARRADRAERERLAREREAAERERRRRAAAERERIERERKPGRVFRDCPGCPEMVILRAGSFDMGSPSSGEYRYRNEGPVHRVRIREPFAVAVHETTRSEFARFVSAARHEMENSCWESNGGSGYYSPSSTWRDPGFAQTGDHPVVCVTWEDAVAYARWLSRETGREYRLLSESEWEYAARAGTRTARYWGAEASGQCGYANGAAAETYISWRYEGCSDGREHTAPVGSFRANGWKLRDMLGNVAEWTLDCWNESHAGAPSDGSVRERGDCSYRVVRGGSWEASPWDLRAADRARGVARIRYNATGFRVARALAP